MKRLQNYLYWLVGTVLLGAVILYGFLQTSITPTLRFCVTNEHGSQEIAVFEGEDGSRSVFLPSYAEMEQVTVVMPDRADISLGGIPLTDGMSCSSFEPKTEYELAIGGESAGLRFLQADNVAALYIDTATGTMDRIHENKEYEEYAAVTLYTADGVIDHQDETAMLKGRGNSTWYFDKKPYALTLSDAGELLGMGADTDWILLANTVDASNLHNKLVFALAEAVGFGWVPECRFVDLYLNGVYNGLYLLTEKVEIGIERLNIDAEAGEFLCKVDMNARWDSLRNPFETPAGRVIEVTDPRVLTEEAKQDIVSLVEQMEQTLLSGGDLRLADNIDLDSWVFRYLIDEISANSDADGGSSYFYYSDGVLHAGPIWDYDLSFGLLWGNRGQYQTAHTFFAKNYKISDHFQSMYYHALCENSSFRERLAQVYRSVFLPVLEQMVSEGIDALGEEIAASSEMNAIRWEAIYRPDGSGETIAMSSAAELKDYLRGKIDFLNSAWLDGTEYCTIQFKLNRSSIYRVISVEKGGLPDLTALGLDHVEWIDSATMEPFHADQGLTADLILLHPQVLTAEEAQTSSLSTRDVLTILSILALLFLFGCLLAADLHQRSRERRAANEHR